MTEDLSKIIPYVVESQSFANAISKKRVRKAGSW